jgi:hypothetical protein
MEGYVKWARDKYPGAEIQMAFKSRINNKKVK